MKLDKNMAAIVTGGASGLGEATARLLAAQDARVAIFDMNATRGEAIAAEIGGVFCVCDVSDEASVDAALTKARAAHGTERILVNCAGIAPGRRVVSKKRETGELAAHDMATFTKTIGVNLIGTFQMISKSAVAMAAEAPITDDGGRGGRRAGCGGGRSGSRPAFDPGCRADRGRRRRRSAGTKKPGRPLAKMKNETNSDSDSNSSESVDSSADENETCPKTQKAPPAKQPSSIVNTPAQGPLSDEQRRLLDRLGTSKITSMKKEEEAKPKRPPVKSKKGSDSDDDSASDSSNSVDSSEELQSSNPSRNNQSPSQRQSRY